MINHEVLTIITVPVPGVTYSFGPDGSTLVAGREHRYFSQFARRSSREIGFVEYVPFDVRVAQSRKATRAAVDVIIDTILSPAA